MSYQILIRRDMNRLFARLYDALLSGVIMEKLFAGALTFCKRYVATVFGLF